jgi:superfamily II DNA/RNA helicase
MKYIERLLKKIEQDDYFEELFSKAEMVNANNFLNKTNETLSESEKSNLMRFADILSHSEDSKHLNWSYRIVSLLAEHCSDDTNFTFFAESILTKLGNFPAIKFMKKDYNNLADNIPLERKLEYEVKKIYQRVPDSDDIFTDDQFKVFNSLIKHNHFSFSGPTSLGKSFLFESYIKYLIHHRKIKENIVILVPTRALINQVYLKLKKEIVYSEDLKYKIFCHPVIPEFNRNEDDNYIFIFTPERFLSYIYETKNPPIGYMLIDEAQKITTTNDSRSPLYYNAIYQAERKSIKLFFASPNIPNPDIFLKLFEKSAEESITVKVSPVSQNRYFLDLLDKKAFVFTEFDKESFEYKDIESSFHHNLLRLGSEQSNIIYCNTVEETISNAIDFSENLSELENKEIEDVIELIEDHLHKEYFLIKCLRKGVAFHFGRLPQRIRVRVEYLFKEKIVNYLFCTSTLLEGVNLPAKNIFIISNAIGNRKFSGVDFWNLAGRAGRLTKELSGNIICIRNKKGRNRWDKPEQSTKIISNKNIQEITPILFSGKENFYKNLNNSLLGLPFSRANYSSSQKEIWDHYANIVLIHEISEEQSVLKSNYLKKITNAQRDLNKISKKTLVDKRILSAYSNIKFQYQNYIFSKAKELPTMKKEFDFEFINSMLKLISDIYAWAEEESKGRNPLYNLKNPEGAIRYYAKIMNDWINSKPLKQMITSSIKYYEKEKKIWVKDKYEDFEKTPKYINIVINNLITDIENILRFKLMNYIDNYYSILENALGKDKAGVNWAKYLEYGTTDPKVIELQNASIPRHLAMFLLEKYDQCLEFENNNLVNIDIKQLKENLDKASPHYKEIKELFF